jgi:hypothetical protein
MKKIRAFSFGIVFALGNKLSKPLERRSLVGQLVDIQNP